MTERAAGLFIWAKTAMDFMEEEKEEDNPRSKLKLILEGKLGRGADNIDTLYRQVLNFHFSNAKGTTLELLRSVLGTIIVAKTPLRPDTLKHIVGRRGEEDERQIEVILCRLSSVISKGDHDSTLRLKHLSFSEFITDAERCYDDRFTVDAIKQHEYVALSCLRLMDEGLKFNICDLETSYLRNDDVEDLPHRVEKSIPPHLSYSCCFWAEHVCTSTTHVTKGHGDLFKEIQNFLHSRLLYWIEALSLIRKVSIASASLVAMARWITVSK